MSDSWSEVTHACPPHGAAMTPCCARTPFELPRTDRITLNDADVTCGFPHRGPPGHPSSMFFLSPRAVDNSPGSASERER